MATLVNSSLRRHLRLKKVVGCPTNFSPSNTARFQSWVFDDTDQVAEVDALKGAWDAKVLTHFVSKWQSKSRKQVPGINFRESISNNYCCRPPTEEFERNHKRLRWMTQHDLIHLKDFIFWHIAWRYVLSYIFRTHNLTSKKAKVTRN